MIEVPIQVLDQGLELPAYARPGDAGVDLRSRIDVRLYPAGGRLLVPTGIAIAIPPGYAGFITPRSGLAARNGVTCLNAPGLIDSGFRGEIHVVLLNTDPSETHAIHRGDRIAQLVIIPIEAARFRVVQALNSTERADGGFGHTGR